MSYRVHRGRKLRDYAENNAVVATAASNNKKAQLTQRERATAAHV